MAAAAVAWRALRVVGRLANDVVSFVVFLALDLLDVILCLVYKVVDFAMEAEWRPCYCSSANGDGQILVSETGGGSKVLCLRSSKLQLEDISDTLYSRPSLVSEISRTTIRELRRIKSEQGRGGERGRRRVAVRTAAATTFAANSTVVKVLQGRIHRNPPAPRWSDCDCKICGAWTSPGGSRDALFVHCTEAAPGAEDVLFIHGFISSSSFWTETVFPNFSAEAKSKYRMLAVDLLGFGRSPKPGDSLYTLREHLEMIERSAVAHYNLRSFHIVAHSLGCILALALAVKYPLAVKSLTLLSPPYFPVPKGVEAAEYVMRRVAPRRVWPAMAMGASVACWYEHISRTVCLLLSKNHRLWELIVKLVTMNRIRTFLMDAFFCHTHNAAWHTMHNVVFGTAGKLEGYLDAICDGLDCTVTVLHGSADELLPVECSLAVKSRVPRARMEVVQGEDHISIVVGRQKAFARELEHIWDTARKS